jgi:putative transposase
VTKSHIFGPIAKVDDAVIKWSEKRSKNKMKTQRTAGTRRTYSAEYKAKVALEAAKGQLSLNELGAEYNIHPNQIGQWRTQMLEALPGIFSGKGEQSQKAAEELQAQLYQQIGQLKVELDWLKKTRTAK